jgi:putative hemolysin
MLRQKHSVTEQLRVRPKLPLPATDLALPANPRMPPLLKTYVSLGAKSCGDACWDPDFGVADILMLLQVEDVCPRYARHFFQRPAPAAKPGDAVTHRA